MPRTTFTATEKLDIILGLKKTNLTKSAYFRACGIPRNTFVRWQNFYMQDGLEGLKERHTWTHYSSELKQQAVSAYLHGEGSLRDIQIRFGLRSTKQLRDWIKKFRYNGTNNSLTPTPSRKQVHIMSRKTTFEERIEIVEYVTVSEHSYSQAAEHFNVSYQQVRSWVLKAKASGYVVVGQSRLKK
ncbi:transposase [Lactiplantibacillus plantarum]|uniref:transposase n=3 Tax=Lactobacillaceae TaxID=33958 RepID=UPI0021A722E5|nr:transposase [Lactiplantibacillus plantarum]